jgi:hypothetical protein
LPAPLYSERFIAITGLVGAIGYTVPAGYRAIVRDVDAYWGGGGSVQVYLHSAAGGTIWSDGNSGPSGFYFSWRGRQVFYVGETITVEATDPTDMTVSGYLLIGP